MELEKLQFCDGLQCDDVQDVNVCGLRAEKNGFRLKLFKNECELMKYGCTVNDDLAYGLINKEYCEQSFADFNDSLYSVENNDQKSNSILFHANRRDCRDYKCINENLHEVCGIRQDGVGYGIKLFKSKCELLEHNCENDQQYDETDLFICKESDNISKDAYNVNFNSNKYDEKEDKNTKNLVVINGNMLGLNGNINDTIDTFFAASHVFDLPLEEIRPFDTRRKHMKYAGPAKVFVPWIVKPKNISNDTFHRPTLSSCYHKCPIRCPDTYAPVCGVPGIVAREPAIMFQNHCFMDVAQCKMFWEGKSSTAHSSSYVESSFLFCMGDEMNAVYRFLPAIRTLQHMGRLKKKGRFRSKLRNFRYLSEFRSGRPKFMG
ncbi:uncharacterized protein LOC124533989 [Vanessa cardui]|uniref:uncharacterized protein LOC124533989 n=1 Tax=Vanessa cardui TaxID=171605 RepID=UPI001F13741B|nr:uncharacterized protein LOC124533989 [Vanessa cardui]